MTPEDTRLWNALASTVTPLGGPRGHRPRLPYSEPEPRQIDLHGKTIRDAHDSVVSFIDMTSYRQVLVITGRSGEICREFPIWAERHPRIRSIKPSRDGGSHFVKIV